ncbi:hypothetical protein A3A74_03015 [Candidatus Roizmanbacteria bacterium RIFCSPLOWO2_01_FULL_35_13]|uniref:Helix-turn-helix domain-containing protein n=1 Tax=Candidatus Roizmanbacteria bacterium RIFCSPLOWO2_01_FULL_35_13 TaxID=1802055 RepID=A0A1F7I9B5_9BACT|nr:MAG: hypothetical protein A3A74_03015 [Candidatus Roizmanbacteria bacterium RIFCSPLOWO2_01_FULL_35_13]
MTGGDNKNMSQTYTVKQVAEMLGYSTNSIYTFLQEGRIKGVRVGKGRFRIPEEELNRILHLSKKSEITTISQSQPAVVEKTLEISQDTPELKTINHSFGLHELHIVSIFDWFFGAAAIVLGASLILYDFKKGQLEFAEFLPWLRTLEISFFAGGLGLILTDLMHKKISFIWHRLFHLILIVTYGTFSYINLKTSEPSGFLLFGFVTLIAGFKFFIRISGIKAFLLFLILYGLGFGVEHITGISHPANSYLSEVFMDNRVFFGSLWIFGVLVTGVFLFLGEKKASVMFWIAMLSAGGGLILNSIFFANTLAWSKSFFLLVTGLTCFLLPVWIVLRVAHENQRRTLALTFGLMTGILLLGIGVIWIMQQNMAEYAARDLQSRLDFGEILVKERMDTVENTLKDASSNQLLIVAFKAENSEELIELLKLIYSNNKVIEKFTALRIDGTILSSYPYDERKQVETSPEFFLPAINERKIYLFDNRKGTDSSGGKLEVGMSAPLIDSEGETVGVLMANIDLIKLKNDLQELANPANEEYFILYNRGGKIIINPDKGINFAQDSLVNNELKEAYNFQGQRVYEISEKIENLNWIIQINSSVDRIFSPTKTVSISIFLTAVLFVGGISLWLVVEKRKYA